MGRYGSLKSNPNDSNSQDTSYIGDINSQAKRIDNTYVQSKLSNLKSKAKLKGYKNEYDNDAVVNTSTN